MRANLVVTAPAPRESQDLPSVPPAFLLAFILGGVYTISQFSRNAIGVVAPDLGRDLSLSAAEIGLLSSVFFLTFALAQIPLGVIIDRYGPKRIMMIGAVVTIASVAVFARAPNFAGLLLGRAFLGLGCSAFLIAPLVIYARLYPPERYSTLTSIHLAIGNLGTVAATVPLALAAAALGWRGAFSLVAIFTLVALAAIAWFVASDRYLKRDGGGGAAASLREVVRVPSFIPMMLMHITTYPSFAAIAGLWGGPWLADVYGLGLDARGRILFVLVASHIVGLFVLGAIDRRLASYKKPLLAGGVLTVATFLFGALVPLPLWATPVWLGVLGFGLGYAPLMMAHSRMLFPPHMLGRGLTLLNSANMLGAFLIQAATGLLVNAFPRAADGSYPPAAYASVMAVLAGLLTMSLAAYARIPDDHPLRQRPT